MQNQARASMREIARHIVEEIADALVDARRNGATHVTLEADVHVISVIPVLPAAIRRDDNEKR